MAAPAALWRWVTPSRSWRTRAPGRGGACLQWARRGLVGSAVAGDGRASCTPGIQMYGSSLQYAGLVHLVWGWVVVSFMWSSVLPWPTSAPPSRKFRILPVPGNQSLLIEFLYVF